MKAAWMILAALLAVADVGTGDTFIRGNEAFAAGRYQEAIQEYEGVAGQGKLSSPLFFNLANAYYKDNQLGPAILNYERALWLDPGNPDARANLRFARHTAGLFAPATSWWERVPSWRSLNQWAWLATGALMVLCLGLVVKLLAPGAPWRWMLKPVIVVSTVVLIVAAAGAAVRFTDANRGVVLKQDAPLRVSPVENLAGQSTLRDGDLVEVLNRRGTFYYISTQDGKTGWASDREVQRIISDF